MKKIATNENVAKARQELIDEHQTVNADNIRTRIGGGSYNTIIKILRELNEKETASIINHQDPDEDQVLFEEGMPFLKSLYHICKKRADTFAMASYKGLQSISQDVEAKATKLDELEEIYEARAQVNEAEIAKLRVEKEAELTKLRAEKETELTKLRAEKDAEISKLQTENTALKDKIQLLSDHLQEAKDSLKEIRYFLQEAKGTAKKQDKAETK